MQTITTQGVVTSEGTLKIEVPCSLPPGLVEVQVTMPSESAEKPSDTPRWEDLYGLGKEVWQGIDAHKYVSELHEDKLSTVLEPPS